MRQVCRSCELETTDQRFVFDFIVLDMTSFNVILGMNWLASYRATIDCFQHRVTFCTPKAGYFHFVGDQGCSITPSSTDAHRQGEFNFFSQLV